MMGVNSIRHSGRLSEYLTLENLKQHARQAVRGHPKATAALRAVFTSSAPAAADALAGRLDIPLVGDALLDIALPAPPPIVDDAIHEDAWNWL